MRFNLPRQFCISHWNMAGALHSPKGMWLHLKNPKLPTVKAIYCFDASFIFICQNPNCGPGKENVKHLPDSPIPPESSAGARSPSLYGNSDGRSQYRSISLCLSFWPTQLHYTMNSDLGHIMPDSSISLRWLRTSSTKVRGFCLNYSLKGVSSVTLIVCLVEWVQPNSVGSNEKT